MLSMASKYWSWSVQIVYAPVSSYVVVLMRRPVKIKSPDLVGPTSRALRRPR